jgi:hypothetical protein
MRSVQLDIWIPDYNLALEYQGIHYYSWDPDFERFTSIASFHQIFQKI